MTMNSSELKLLYLTYIYLKFLKIFCTFLFFQKQLKPTMMTHVRNVVLFFHTFFFFSSVSLPCQKKSIYCDNTKSITMANIYGAKYWKSLSNYVL